MNIIKINDIEMRAIQKSIEYLTIIHNESNRLEDINVKHDVETIIRDLSSLLTKLISNANSNKLLYIMLN